MLLLLSIPVFAQGKETELTLMTYNLRYGERASMERLAEEIKAANPDFVALQEVDINTNRKGAMGNNRVNFINRLAELTGMFGYYGKTINFSGGYYGVGILSKTPMASVRRVSLPNPKNTEPRVLLIGEFEVNGGKDLITFVSTHFDYIDDEAIAVQAAAASEELRKIKTPVIIAGDLNSEPSSQAISILKKDFKDLSNDKLTFPAWKPKIKIDWLFGYPPADFTLLESITPEPTENAASDHLPIISKIKVKF